MEIIGVILVIIFALVSASDKRKKAANQAGKPQPMNGTAARTAANQRSARQMSMAERQARLEELRRKKAERAAAQEPVMPSNASAAFESSLTELKELLSVAQVSPSEGESMLDDADCHGGSMPHTHAEGDSALEDEECVGGSMAHAHTQGESRAAQRRRLSQLDHDREADGEARDSLIPSDIDARALRRAVVMAEVLGKPKAMQRGRFVA